MMSALVKSLPPTTRKRLLRQTQAEFDALLTALSTTGSAGQVERESIEWMRDLFLKRIAEAGATQDSRRNSKKAGQAKPAATDERSPTAEPKPSTGVDFEL